MVNQQLKDKIVEVLGENLFNDLKEIKEEIKLDRTLFRFFDRCFKLNKVLAKHIIFREMRRAQVSDKEKSTRKK